MALTEISVGKAFPGAVPKSEGCVLEMADDGSLACYIQMPGLNRAERQAFKKSFFRYGYLETGTTPPIAVWVWMFPPPLNPMDVNFNASIVTQKAIDRYFETENGQVKNMIMFYLLDGQILQGLKMVGLEPDAVRLFQGTIRKQRGLAEGARAEDYVRALDGVYAYSTEELFEMAVKFKK